MEELNEEEMLGFEGGASQNKANAIEIKSRGRIGSDDILLDVGNLVCEIKVARVLTGFRDVFGIEGGNNITKGKSTLIHADGFRRILKINWAGHQLRIHRYGTRRGTPKTIELEYRYLYKIAGSSNNGYRDKWSKLTIRW